MQNCLVVYSHGYKNHVTFCNIYEPSNSQFNYHIKQIHAYIHIHREGERREKDTWFYSRIALLFDNSLLLVNIVSVIGDLLCFLICSVEISIYMYNLYIIHDSLVLYTFITFFFVSFCVFYRLPPTPRKILCRKLLETTMAKLHIQHGGIMMTSMNTSG